MKPARPMPPSVLLQIKLARYRCEGCGANMPRVYHTRRRIRYVACRACGRTGKVATIA